MAATKQYEHFSRAHCGICDSFLDAYPFLETIVQK